MNKVKIIATGIGGVLVSALVALVLFYIAKNVIQGSANDQIKPCP